MYWRGRWNAPIVLVGEAPGEAEDAVGLPFVGPSGRLLDGMLSSAGIPEFDVCFVNTVLCTPYETSLRAAIRQPTKEEIKNCSGRLLEFLNRHPRKVIIAVGKVAEQALTKLNLEFESIVHPSFILRQGESQATVWMKRTILQLKKIANG